jgi:thiol-disulfide isomerase/thioredoxin
MAPDIQGDDLDGKFFKLSDQRGKIVFLDFWADWCPHCRNSYPYQKRLAKRLEKEPFVLLGINSDFDRAEARQAARNKQLTWRSWWDSPQLNTPIGGRWGVVGIPTTFLIDPQGVIRYRFPGAQPDHVLDQAVDELLGEVKKEKPKE